MTNTHHEQDPNDISLLKEAAKAATIGAALGAALGAVTATRQSGEDDQAQALADVEEPEEQTEATQSEVEQPEEDAEAPEEQAGDESQADVEEAAVEEGEEPRLQADDEPEEPADGQAQRTEQVEAPAGLEVVRRVRGQLELLTGRSVEGVLGMQREDGEGGCWRVTLEVVELPRIPSSTDVLAAYDVVVDDDGEIQEWRRARRYVRSRADEEGQ